MGAYFIRRKSRNALYRKVLARYVQMSTAGGVTQAIFPEGGLSLDGGLAPPKLGLMKYLTEDLSLEARDVVFVPVALNYDRVLEDTVLVRAGQEGERRFKAGVWRVFQAGFRQIWLRVTGRFHRFGYAAVSFGAPLSLRNMPHLAEDPEALGQEVMNRVAEIVPVLPVPLAAHVLISGAPMTEQEAIFAVEEALEHLDAAHVHLPRQDVSYAVEVGLRALQERKIIAREGGQITVNEERRALLAFYANSIKHLF
jgi:glycerol-3-phosphate O-acyltransferase